MNRINWLAIGIFLLLGVMMYGVGEREDISSKKKSAISCGPARADSEHNSWPKDGGNGCAHQSVSAAFLGRHKRDKTHGC